MPSTTPAQRYLSAKELSAEFTERGLRPCSLKAMRALIAECDESVGPCILLTDAIAFLKANRDWQPYQTARNRSISARSARNRRAPTIVTL